MSVTEINRLTSEQEAQLIPWRDKYIKIGLRTGEANWEQFEMAVEKCYRFANLNWPVPVIRVSSPIVGAFAAPVAAQIITRLKADKKYSAVDSPVGSAVHSAVDSATKMFWHNWMGGQFWISWQSWEGFFRHVCNLTLSGDSNDRAQAYEDAQTSVSYWWPNKYFVMACNHPSAIRRDNRGRLHSENEKSIEWPDGWGLYSIHGIRVPAKYVTMSAEQIDCSEILKEPNAQIRMAVISKIGFARMLGKLPCIQISRGDSEGCSLIEFTLGNDQIVRALHLKWLTKQGIEQTVLPVPRTRAQFGADCPDNIDDFEQVRRWTLGLNKNAQIVLET